jgi:hypothetical protein
MVSAAFLLTWIGGFFIGVFALLGYMIWRLMRNTHMDDSNIANAVRILSHLILHPHDFGRMWYCKPDPNKPGQFLGVLRPFWYYDQDEFEGVVRSRPKG